MANVTLICGKLCSGKTTLAENLAKKNNALLLSCDEMMLRLFPEPMGEKYDEAAQRAKEYLHALTVKVVRNGVNVILDWGFWTKAEREEVSLYYDRQGIAYRWLYVDSSDEQWRRNIAARNKAVESGKTDAYYIDEGLLAKMNMRFEVPDAEELALYQTFSQ